MNTKLKDFLLKEREYIEGFYSAYDTIKDSKQPVAQRTQARQYLTAFKSWIYQTIRIGE